MERQLVLMTSPSQGVKKSVQVCHRSQKRARNRPEPGIMTLVKEVETYSCEADTCSNKDTGG